MKICFIIQKRFYTFLSQNYKLSAFRQIRQWTCRSLSGIMNPKTQQKSAHPDGRIPLPLVHPEPVAVIFHGACTR